MAVPVLVGGGLGEGLETSFRQLPAIDKPPTALSALSAYEAEYEALDVLQAIEDHLTMWGFIPEHLLAAYRELTGAS